MYQVKKAEKGHITEFDLEPFYKKCKGNRDAPPVP